MFYPPYTLLKTIAHHDARETFLALDTKTDTEVIIKALHLSELNHWKNHEQFERELQALLYLKHPQIPKYITHFEASHQDKILSCVVIEKVTGVSLAERIEKGVRISETEAIAMIQSVLVPLAYLHSLSPPLIHRDIKPSNLMVDGNNTAYIIDFGAMQGTSPTHTVAGTFGYMAPEQITGRASVRSDLYNLGVTLLTLLSHLSPEAMPREDLRFKIDEFLTVSPFLRRGLQTLVAPLEKDRFASAEEALSYFKKEQSLHKEPICPPSENIAQQGRLKKEVSADHIRYTLPAAYQWGDILGETAFFTFILLAPFGGLYWIFNTFLPVTYAQWANYLLSPFFVLIFLLWLWLGSNRLKSNVVTASLQIEQNTLTFQHRWFNRFSEKAKTFHYTQIKVMDFNHTYGLLFTGRQAEEFEVYFEATLYERLWLESELKAHFKEHLPHAQWTKLEKRIKRAQAEEFLLEAPEENAPL